MSERKRRIVLTPQQKLKVVESVKAGGKRSEIATRFGITPQTVTSIFEKYGELVGDPTPEPLPQTEKPVPIPLANANDVAITLDGHYITMKIHKSKFTGALLGHLLG